MSPLLSNFLAPVFFRDYSSRESNSEEVPFTKNDRLYFLHKIKLRSRVAKALTLVGAFTMKLKEHYRIGFC